jgi:hypothetical protein
MRTESDVDRIVGQEQTGPLDMLPWIEREDSAGERPGTGPGDRRGERYRTIQALDTGGQIERVQVKSRSARFESVCYDV